MKLWDKGQKTSVFVEQFTVGNDRIMDLALAEYDVYGSIAHAIMLCEIKIITKEELALLKKELITILNEIKGGKFSINKDVEDIHSQVELTLTGKLGDIGKKIHTARSRNDQVLLDMRLYLRQKICDIVNQMQGLFECLVQLSEGHKNILMPGYTHFQVAMPSSFGLWFGAYAEALTDDLQLLLAAYKIINQNPLGSAAGYGTSFPINRTLTTKLLGFDDLNYNVVYAQMGRGKTEKTVSFALSSTASTLSKFAMDACLFMGQDFNFISFPEELTTGSSIMPHKKNPDVLELIRAKCNRVQNLPAGLSLMTANLPSGYHRDFQLLKEAIIPAINDIEQCIRALMLMLGSVVVNKNLMIEDKYKYIFSVEEANKLVLEGKPFRDAYREVGDAIKNNSFKPDKKVNHTHEGSIGNLCNEKITEKFYSVKKEFEFEKYLKAIKNLEVS